MNVVKLIASVIISFAAAAIGNIATIPNIPTWYQSLEKPFFNPPNWVFGPVWTLLYLLIGLSLWIIWTTPSKNSKKRAYGFFAAQLALNALWSLVFFGLHQPEYGIVVILLLLTSIILTMKYFWKFSHTATYLLIPYLSWVGFATYLNIAIAVLN